MNRAQPPFLLILPALFFLGSSGRNIVPDAVSRATIWNQHLGELSSLSDGRVPTLDDPDAPSFRWESKGILVFSWEEPLLLARVRMYVGAVGNDYQVRAYLGGRLDETGTLREPEGELKALVDADERTTNQWLEIPLPEATEADNIELWSLGASEFYEVEIYARSGDDTAVAKVSWAQIKAAGMRRVNATPESAQHSDRERNR